MWRQDGAGIGRPVPDGVTAAWFQSAPERPELPASLRADADEPDDGDGELGAGLGAWAEACFRQRHRFGW